MNHSDRHENSRWVFRTSKVDAVEGVTVRLYRSRSNPLLFKRVAPRTCTSSAGWESVSYTLKGSQIDGQQVWVFKAEDVEGQIAERVKNAEISRRILSGEDFYEACRAVEGQPAQGHASLT